MQLESSGLSGITSPGAHLPPRRTVLHGAVWVAPAVAAAATVPTYASSAVPALTFDPARSYISQNPDGTWTFCYLGASVDAGGQSLDANQLTMTVTFLPDGSSGNQLAVLSGAPANFSANSAGTKVAASYVYGLAAATGHVPISDGSWFSTTTAAQSGSFVVTVSAPGFQSDTYTVHVPPTVPYLTFHPGTSFVRHSTQNGTSSWEYDFRSAFVTATGADIAPGTLLLTVSFEPDPGATGGQDLLGYRGGPTGWSQQGALLTTEDTAVYRYLSAVNASTGTRTVPITDGRYFQTHYGDSTEFGYLVFTFTAPGFLPAIYRIHVPAT